MSGSRHDLPLCGPRTTVCLQCSATTTNGSRCPTCAGGTRSVPKSTAYRDPRYVARRKRLLAEHRATFGARCPRCLTPEDRAVRRTWLTLNHVTTLSRGGDVMGPVEVMCLGCNDRQLHADRPDVARRGR